MVEQFVAKLAGRSVKFGVITYRDKKYLCLARHSVILGADLDSLYQQDVAVLGAMLPTLDGIQKVAATAILDSRKKSLEVGIGNNPLYVHAPQNADTYVLIPGLPGVKVHKTTGEMYVCCLSQLRVVLEEGLPRKPVKSSDLTIAKKQIERSLASSKFRQMILRRIHSVTVDGETITMDADES
jgi:hypothetical protein